MTQISIIGGSSNSVLGGSKQKTANITKLVSNRTSAIQHHFGSSYLMLLLCNKLIVTTDLCFKCLELTEYGQDISIYVVTGCLIAFNECQ